MEENIVLVAIIGVPMLATSFFVCRKMIEEGDGILFKLGIFVFAIVMAGCIGLICLCLTFIPLYFGKTEILEKSEYGKLLFSYKINSKAEQVLQVDHEGRRYIFGYKQIAGRSVGYIWKNYSVEKNEGITRPYIEKVEAKRVLNSEFYNRYIKLRGLGEFEYYKILIPTKQGEEK